MKIVQDMQRRDQGYIDERIREIATEIAREEFRASKNDEWPWMDHPEKWDAMKREARDSALEAAAAYVAGKGRSKDATEIRALKSQPAAQASAEKSWCEYGCAPGKHDHRLHYLPPKPITSWPQMIGAVGSPEYVALLKERDELRATIEAARRSEGFGALPMENELLKQHVAKVEAKLTAAEKAIKDAYDAVPFGWRDEDGYRYLKAVLLILSEHLRIGRKEESK